MNTLSAGTRLGPYEITGAIGAGGMGEVFRARDTTLNRDVAIKVLPGAMAGDAERLARFKREAQVLASLNHPNIAHVYGFESSSLASGAHAHFLAMEMVEGEDLAERLSRGAVPVDEAIAIARQIAEGVEEAHDHGIVHRDLKPANIKVTRDGKVKVLDFGLAKALEATAGGAAASSQLSHSPTMSRLATEAGMILGTAAYMSPEQARGKTVDKRADIWAFGVILFEMLAGGRLFSGETVSDVLAAVLRQEIDWARLPAATPPRVRALLRRCLEKDVRQRLQAMGEARIALERSADPNDVPELVAASPVAAGRGGPRGVLPWGIAALALVACAAAAVVVTRRMPDGASRLRTSLALPEGLGIPTLAYYGNQSLATFAVSPAGDQAAIVGVQDGEGALYLRRFDSFDAVRLTKTEAAMAPFFSPDGRRLGFFARGHLWRIDLPGGVPVDLAPAATSSLGGSWGEDGRIVYTPSYADALWTIPAEGGKAQVLTKVDAAAGELSHRWPCVLPRGAGILFVVKLATNEALDDARIAVADPKTGAHRTIVEGGSMPRYLDDGRLVFARAGKLYAVAFDLASRKTRGAPAPVLDGVSTGPATGAAWYDVTRRGLLAYVPGGKVTLGGRFSWEGSDRPSQVLDRLEAGRFGRHRLSRDGTRAVVQIPAANDKLWLLDMEQTTATRLTGGGGNDTDGVISPDGRFLLFVSDRAGGGYRFFRMPLDGSAPPAPLLEGEGRIHSLSYKARMLGLSLESAQDGLDAYVMAVAEDGTPAGKAILVAGGPNNQTHAAVSADGTLVAYDSSESGREDVYVARLADPGSRRRVTNDGGTLPLWSREGSRLYYMSNNRVLSVNVGSSPEVRFDAPRVVSGSDVPGSILSFDVAPDGTSVLVGRVTDLLMLRRDIRLWPGWGKTLPQSE